MTSRDALACPACGPRSAKYDGTRVVDSHLRSDLRRRYRRCGACTKRWATVELHASDLTALQAQIHAAEDAAEYQRTLRLKAEETLAVERACRVRDLRSAVGVLSAILKVPLPVPVRDRVQLVLEYLSARQEMAS